jgi:hypothetical protein
MSKLFCLIFGHNYYVELRFSGNCQKLRCARCHKAFGINHDVRTILEWDSELEALHREINPEAFKTLNK